MMIVYSKTDPIIIQRVVATRKITPMYVNNSCCMRPKGDDLELQCK
jgi:hypothetical protein